MCDLPISFPKKFLALNYGIYCIDKNMSCKEIYEEYLVVNQRKEKTLLQAAVREVLEETSFDISKQSIHDYIYHIFKCQPSDHPGAVLINFDDEYKGFTWVTPTDAFADAINVR